MSTLPQSTAKSNSLAAKTALTTAADNAFIADADAQILKAIDQGVYFVHCKAFSEIDVQAIATYYANLGYAISFPDFQADLLQVQGPAALFGQFWTNFWNNSNVPQGIKMPLRIIISWGP